MDNLLGVLSAFRGEGDVRGQPAGVNSHMVCAGGGGGWVLGAGGDVPGEVWQSVTVLTSNLNNL